MLLILSTLRDKKQNRVFDSAIKTFKQSNAKQSEKSAPVEPVNPSDPNEQYQLTAEERQAAEEEDSRSTSLSIVKMALFNLQQILKKILESEEFMTKFKFAIDQ